jgi:dUTP pyrophosphatase
MGDELIFYKLVDTAFMPTRQNESDVGLDLKSAFTYEIEPNGGRVVVDTGLQIKLPEGTYGRIAPRSGIASNNGIDVLGGVIDPGYSGRIQIILINHGQSKFLINPGQRVAQLICEKVFIPNVRESTVKMCSIDGRMENGFGSTGLF